MQPGPVIEDAFLVVAKSQHLHLDVELPPGLVTSLDVQNGELVIQGFLGIEGVEQLDVLDLLAWDRIKDLVNHIDEDGPRGFSAQEVLEGVIHLGIDAQDHELFSNPECLSRE
jgi:hypothetical protein